MSNHNDFLKFEAVLAHCEKRASEESQNVTVYSLTNTGQTVADQFIEVRDKFDEFFKLDSFQGFRQE